MTTGNEVTVPSERHLLDRVDAESCRVPEICCLGFCAIAGVAGFVVKEDQQVLVISEKYHARNNISSWKLPGGHADKG